ncbi:LAME_0E05182g1_1 [Lachancea meyersii CBS 8951]|uniref:LAME_0E05182g1_1 n=1 Tax=Lachancea meyersii CBS 8951 TaxID=1266667 RepID=A0A1G4JHK2_9SACH|nr:LAME_0E05182g1_1 [Lachancea meyersii CBS 8951]
MSEDDEKRTKQLEEARKRVEELKNRRKKKDQKKKKAETEDPSSGNPEKESNTEGSVNVNSEGNEKVEIGNDHSESLAKEEPEAKDLSPELKSIDTTVPELEKSSSEAAAEEAKTVSETSTYEPLESEIPENELQQESVDKVQTETEPNDQALENELPSSSPEARENESAGASSLFPEDSPSFLSELQRENDRIALIDLQKQVTSLTAELRKLKFVNMEQETTIEELQEHVQTLEAQLSASQQEVASERQKFAEYQATALSLAHQEPHTPRKQPPVFSTPLVDRSALDKWKGWNVDMTQWRSIGSGPIVHL